MSQNQIKNLEEKLACENEKIFDLKEKLHAYDKNMAANGILQNNFNELQRWVENAVTENNRANDKQLNDIKCISKEVEESESAVASFRLDNNKLTNVNESLKEQLKTLQQNEQRIITEIEKLETSNGNLENDLCDLKVSLTTFVPCYFV